MKHKIREFGFWIYFTTLFGRVRNSKVRREKKTVDSLTKCCLLSPYGHSTFPFTFIYLKHGFSFSLFP